MRKLLRRLGEFVWLMEMKLCAVMCEVRKSTLLQQGGSGTDRARIVLPIVDWHISTTACIVGIGKELAHEVLQCESTLLEYAGFAVLCKDHIIWCQCGRGANCDTFFAGGNL